MANVVGSFFKCFVSCVALARTAVADSSGGRTQVVTVVASMVVLSVMVWLSALLEYLPKVSYFAF
jgi:MFS superfamily sulfate permease-like transporter